MIKFADKKIAKFGFSNVKEDAYGVRYERENKKYKFVQVVEIHSKANGRHILQSYDKDLMDEECVGNVCVGLTSGELKAFYRKMKECKLLCKEAQND